MKLDVVPEKGSTAANAPRVIRNGAATDRRAPTLAGEKLATPALFIVAALISFFHLGSYGLWDPDEARYAEIAREMLQLRDFIVPHLNYVAYIEKPPLLYWLTVLSYEIFGVNEFAARLIPAASAMLGVAATFVFADRALSRRHALMAGAILATAPLYAVMGQVLTTDMLLSALITIAIFGLFLHHLEGGKWCWLAYVAMALATLTKGPVGIVLPAASMASFLWWEGQLSGSIRRFHAIAGIAILIGVCAPWFVAISLREPGFVDFYFVGEHLRRVFERSYSHREAFYFYIPVLAAGLLPWSMLVPFLTWRRMEPRATRRFCVITSIVIIGAFSFASSKLIPYILPAFPPLAVLLADAVVSCRWPGEGRDSVLRAPDSRILMESGPLLGILGAAVLVAALEAPRFRSPYPMAVQPALYAIGGVLVFGGAMTTLAFMARLTGAGLSLIVITTAGALCAGTWARLDAEPLRSYASLSREVAQRAPGATLICYLKYVQSLPFYTRQRVILVGARTELKFGAEHAADAGDYFFESDRDLLRLWYRPGENVMVLEASDLARLKPRLGTFTLIGKEHTKRAILNTSQTLVRN